MSKIKIALLTGGGDAPGLNAVIHSFTKACKSFFPGCEVIGYRQGYNGLYNNDFIKLDDKAISGIMHKGGTILYSSNKDNLFDYAIEENGKQVHKDVSEVAIEHMKNEGVDVLAILGGDGTLTSARDFSNKKDEHGNPKISIIGIPKTIDNDLGATDVTFGFDTAVSIVTEALGRLHTTAESHHRVMVVEVMGRDSGWIALSSGIAGSADVVLIPEKPYDINKVVDKINDRSKNGKNFTIIVITEGATNKGGQVVVSKIVKDSPDPIRFGGIGAKLAKDLEKLIKFEVRSCQLGHTQRGGTPTAYDRILSARYGVYAAGMIRDKQFGKMVAFVNGQMTAVDLNDVIGHNKYVTDKHELVHVAKSIGIAFAD